MMDVRGKRVLVVGLARSGRAAAHFLRRQGAMVMVTDSRPPSAFTPEIKELLSARIGVELGTHREETFLRQDLVVVSPGVPWDLPQVGAARRRGIPVIPEIELAGWFLKGALVGITGSNGKTTATALLGRMLEASGFHTFVGGNIGVPLISAVGQVSAESMVVAELSSFQLEAIQSFRPHVAVLLNISPNHLDRHPSFEAYVRAKAQMFRNQTASDCAVLNADDPTVMSLVPDIRSRKIFFSLRYDLPEGLLVSGNQVLYRVRHLERELVAVGDVRLRGAFNLENVLAAAAAACVLGANFDAVARAVREFRGVEHRLELVGEIQGIQFYNDSKATSVDATVKALSTFERGVHLILGGKDKGAPYAPIRPLLEGRVREVLLIGAAAERIAQELSGAVELIHTGDLETAVRKAFEWGVPGDVVLLAPACSSFDQFQDFEHRGRVFKEIVARLAEEAERTALALPGSSYASSGPAARAGGRSRQSGTAAQELLSGEPGTLEVRDSKSQIPDCRSQVPNADSADLGPSSILDSKPQASDGDFAKVGQSLIAGGQSAIEATDGESPTANLESGVSGPQSPGPAVRTADSGPGGRSSRAPSPEPRVRSHPELINVYETDAEELAPLDIDIPPDESEAFPVDVAAEPSQSSEAAQGESLMFEVVARGARNQEGGIRKQKAKSRRRKAGQSSSF